MKNTKIKLSQLIKLLVLLLFSISVYSAETPFYKQEFTPENIASKSKELGVSNVLNTIANSELLYQQLQERIKSGEKAWLDIFLLLRQHPESELGAQFDVFLAYAIETNPHAVLSIMHTFQEHYDSYFQDNQLSSYATLVCGNVIEDWMLGCQQSTNGEPLAESAYRTLGKRLTVMQQHSDNTYLKEKTDCIKKIEKAKAFWGKFCK